jgi:hypothetical protein
VSSQYVEENIFPPSKGSLTPEELATLNAEAGWPYQDIPEAVVVEEEESGGNPGETDPESVPMGGVNYNAMGTFQELTDPNDKTLTKRMLDDPLYDAEAARSLWSERKGWGPWIPDTEPGYVHGVRETPDEVAERRFNTSYKGLIAAAGEATTTAIPDEATYVKLVAQGKAAGDQVGEGPQEKAIFTGAYSGQVTGSATAPGWLNALDAMMNPVPSGGTGVVGAFDELFGLLSGSTEAQIVSLTFSRVGCTVLSMGAIAGGVYLIFGSSMLGTLTNAVGLGKTPTALKVSAMATDRARTAQAHQDAMITKRADVQKDVIDKRIAAQKAKDDAVASHHAHVAINNKLLEDQKAADRKAEVELKARAKRLADAREARRRTTSHRRHRQTTDEMGPSERAHHHKGMW